MLPEQQKPAVEARRAEELPGFKELAIDTGL